jgi:hypothetical protein
MGLSEVEFAQRLGVTVRAVDLWESEVVLPSVLTSMVIRAEAAKLARASSRPSRGARGSRVSPSGRRRVKPTRPGGPHKGARKHR